jgi:hypothetical protein
MMGAKMDRKEPARTTPGRDLQEAAMADQSPKKPAAKTDETAPVEEAVEPHVPVTEDAKSAFAAALERKKQAGQARAAHLDGHGGVGGATSSHKATRTFRRKSGSA